MTALSGPLQELLEEMVPKLAAKAHRSYPMIPFEDFEQECWLRAHQRSSKLAKHLREDKRAFIWTELRAACTKLGKEDDRFRRTTKAAAEGYQPWDEEFYSTGVLARLLADLFGAEEKVELAIQAAQGPDSAGIYRHDKTAEDMDNYMVMLIDVQVALGRLRKGDRNILRAYYGLPVEDTDEGRWERRKLASSMGLTYEALRQRAYRALRTLQRELGDETPWRKGDVNAGD